MTNEKNLGESAANQVRIYSPQSALRDPQRLVREMGRDLYASRELAWRLFVRDLSARYRQSLLGYVWAFVPPVAATATFVLLSRSGILSPGDTSIPYPLFVLIGTVLWQTFVDAITTPIRVVNAAKPMLAKLNFPREAILLAGLLEVLFNLSIRLILLIPVFLYYQIVPPSTAPLAIFGIVALIALGFMIGVLLTPIGMLYTDIGQALTFMLSFWMLVTPVVYTVPSSGPLALVSGINPVSPAIVTTREWLAVGAATQLEPTLWILLATLLLSFLGWMLYRLAMPMLVERMGG